MVDKRNRHAVHVDHVAYYHTYKYNSLQRLNKPKSMHGVKRVIAFCILTAVLPASLIILPLYLRHTVFADVTYHIAESDIIEIRDGISSIFCQRHILQMNTSFNAFQLNHKPEISKNLKHIRLKKSMSLPDDTLEYWGFYLLRGATVALKVCSRYDGSRILVVKGERNLRTCGLLEHNKNKIGTNVNKDHGNVVVTFESAAEIVNSRDLQRKANEEYLPPDVGNHGGEDIADDGITTAKSSNSFDQVNSKTTARSMSGSESRNSITPRQRKSEQTTTHTSKKITENDAADSAEPTATIRNEENLRNHRKRRHHGKHGHHDKINNHDMTSLQESLTRDDTPSDANGTRAKRDAIYDRAINHGGNALNFSNNTSDSVSSFENNLLNCYNGDILLAQGFPPSQNCKDVQYLDNGVHMITKHEVASDGYYYYIFYSDNDYVQNDIHAVFDIYKPTFQYSNISESKGCVNSTNCSFPIPFWSDEHVIVEVPTRDGIEHEEDDISHLISTCQPRMAVYIIFPISVLFLVLTCAFL